MRKIFNLRDSGKTLIMGVLNITPDSFSDGGIYFSVDAAKAHVRQMLDDGADIIDVGAESTRPNSTPISVDEELARIEKILPAVRTLDTPISIDTYKPEVAMRALELGVDLINDVRGLEDSRMIDLAKKFNVPVIAMHNEKCCYKDIVNDVKNFFRRTLANCSARDFDTAQIIFDPGIGFGKTTQEDLTIMRRLDELKTLDGRELFLALGISRKSFIGRTTGLALEERDEATGALCAYAITKGVNVVRVHNVKMISRMCLMIDKLIKEK